MTQPVEAVGGEATPVDPTKVFEDLAREEFDIKEGDEEEQPAEAVEAEAEAVEGAEDVTEAEAEADDLPPIDAPVSWDAEAKEAFKQLPRDLQETVQKREAERERFVQQKSQEATRARQEATQAATAELAQIERGYAQQFQQAAAILDQLSAEPDYSLLATNPAEFARQAEVAKHFRAQRDAAQRNAQDYAQQAQAREQQLMQVEQAEMARIITEQFPEYADPTTGPELQRKLSAVAKRIGYTDELISQARAQDILAMRTVAELADKADKYDALMKDKMSKVRAAKGKPPVTARPGVAQGADTVRARDAQSALEVARSSKNRDVQGAAFLQYLEKTGQI